MWKLFVCIEICNTNIGQEKMTRSKSLKTLESSHAKMIKFDENIPSHNYSLTFEFQT